MRAVYGVEEGSITRKRILMMNTSVSVQIKESEDSSREMRTGNGVKLVHTEDCASWVRYDTDILAEDQVRVWAACVYLDTSTLSWIPY